MKTLKYIFVVLSLVIIPKLSAQTLKTVEANPINVAVSLMHRTDTASITKVLKYYGYLESPTPDTSTPETYKIFTHPNGSTIRYNHTARNQPLPMVEVTSKVSAKEKDQILHNLKFEKNGNAYEQKSIGYSTRCTFGPQGILILTRVMKTKE